MQVISCWSWIDEPETPELLRNEEFLAVLWGKNLKIPVIGFSLSNRIPADFSHTELRDREMFLFGCDAENPDSFMTVRDGKIR